MKALPLPSRVSLALLVFSCTHFFQATIILTKLLIISLALVQQARHEERYSRFS